MKNKGTLITLAIILIMGGAYLALRKPASEEPTPYGEVTPTPTPQEGEKQTEVQSLLISKDKIAGATADVNVSVGDKFGKFTVSKILDRNVGGPDAVEFSGEETINGSVGYSSIGAFYLQAKAADAAKLPRLGSAVGDVMLLISEPPTQFSREDFTFDEGGNSNVRPAKVRIKNLNLMFPSSVAAGSFDAAEVNQLLVILRLRKNHDCADLCDRLGQNGRRQHRQTLFRLGEVTLVQRDVLDADDAPVRLELGDAIDQEKRISVREDAFDRRVVERQRQVHGYLQV